MTALSEFLELFLRAEFASMQALWSRASADEQMRLFREAFMCHAPAACTPPNESWSQYVMDLQLGPIEHWVTEYDQRLQRLAPRKLFKRSYYSHPSLGEVLRAYVSEPDALELPAYSRRIDIAAIEGKPYVIGWAWCCARCAGSGQDAGQVCRWQLNGGPVCQEGWIERGGITLNEVGTPVRVERLAAPDEPRSFDAHEKEA